MSRIFISYRRDDSQAWAGRLYDHIEAHFDPEHIFMDVDMEPGVDFVEEIEGAVGSCDVLIAVIGRSWLTAADGAGRRRLDDEQDWVRLEIGIALRRGVRVIPCLVGGVRMPKASELPKELSGLARRQAVILTHERFRSDAERLTRAVARILDRKQARPSPPKSAPEPEPRPEAGESRISEIDGLEYVWIPPGELLMGAVPQDDEAYDDEKPRHKVKITKGFWMSGVPVTGAAYKRFAHATGQKMPENPSFNADWKQGDHPIVNVTWQDAAAYCEWAGGRLPTEAEWEYSARGGKEGLKYPWGNEIGPANAKYGSRDGTSAAGSYQPNGFGLYDMAGNVWEWTADWYGPYSEGHQKDPEGLPNGTARVVRGGSWYIDTRSLRSSYRNRIVPGSCYNSIGFRCTREVIP